MEVYDSIKKLMSFGFLGFINYSRFKNFKNDSFELKDRLNSYNIKYPKTRAYNDYLLKESHIYFYGLIFNFVLILSTIFFGFTNTGLITVSFFILTELHLFNDIIFTTYHKYILNSENTLNLLFTVPLEYLILIPMVLGLLTVSLKPKN